MAGDGGKREGGENVIDPLVEDGDCGCVEVLARSEKRPNSSGA
jgi:hypothetical protein